MTKLETAVNKVKLKFAEMREEGSKWTAVTTAMASINQVVGTIDYFFRYNERTPEKEAYAQAWIENLNQDLNEG